MSESKQGPFIATLNAVLVDKKHDDIVAIAVVANEEEGELWFGANKPEDGTQVDYVLHEIETMFAAPALLEACKKLIRMHDDGDYFADGHFDPESDCPVCNIMDEVKAAIAQAEKG